MSDHEAPNWADTQLRWSRRLIDGLAASGVRHAVISPGSRSTPLVLAAHACDEIDCRLVVDERSAAFFALGQVRASGTPSLLICTSGSAAGHYLPAVIEAERSRLPLILLSADRPPELHHRDAAQTIDQVKLFGSYLRLYVELGMAEASPHLLHALGHSAARAVFASRTPIPGPVQINAWMRKPFEGSPSVLQDPAPAPRVATFPALRAPDPAGIAALSLACREAKRGVIVCGPAPLWRRKSLAALERLSEATGMPILADATSQLRFTAPRERGSRCEHFALLERTGFFGGNQQPDLVLQLGGAQVLGLGDTWNGCPRAILTDYGWQDSTQQAQIVVHGDPGRTLEQLAQSCSGTPGDPHWAAKLETADQRTSELLGRLLDHPSAGSPLSEASALRAVLHSLPGDALLMLANSLPVREANAFAGSADADVAVLHQRGANGIDGTLSGAAGAASATQRPVVLLCGDLAFLHDLGSLAQAKDESLTIVVFDNGGGRLFEHLPIATRPEAAQIFADYFVARQDVDLAGVSRAFGLPVARVTNRGSLAAAFEELQQGGGGVLVVAIEEDSVTLHRRVLSALGDMLDSL